MNRRFGSLFTIRLRRMAISHEQFFNLPVTLKKIAANEVPGHEKQ